MATASDHPNDGPPSRLRQIDLVADRFEQEWRQGNCPPIAAFLDDVPAELRSQLLAELVCIDLEHRLRTNRPVTLDDYFREFPELKSLPEAALADLEAHARQCCDELGRTVDHVSAATVPELPLPCVIGRYPIAGQLGPAGKQPSSCLSTQNCGSPWWSSGSAPRDC